LGLCNNPVEEVRYSLDIRSLEQGKVKVSYVTNLLIITGKYVRVSENELKTTGMSPLKMSWRINLATCLIGYC
jgi:predicted amidohydrolase